jgi:tRNA(Ile)-lysidine synthase
VVTSHTASDRAETVLLNLARGSHRRGLGALPSRRRLDPDPGSPALVRPLLPFTRQDTGRICRELGLPVWIDGSNDDPRFARNRVRAEVLPVLEALHPGCARRISAQAERWARELDGDGELLTLALESLAVPAGAPAQASLDRRRFTALSQAGQARLLQHWLQRHGRPLLASDCLAQLLTRLPPPRGPGRMDLADGWQLGWQTSTLDLIHPEPHG